MISISIFFSNWSRNSSFLLQWFFPYHFLLILSQSFHLSLKSPICSCILSISFIRALSRVQLSYSMVLLPGFILFAKVAYMDLKLTTAPSSKHMLQITVYGVISKCKFLRRLPTTYCDQQSPLPLWAQPLCTAQTRPPWSSPKLCFFGLNSIQPQPRTPKHPIHRLFLRHASQVLPLSLPVPFLDLPVWPPKGMLCTSSRTCE